MFTRRFVIYLFWYVLTFGAVTAFADTVSLTWTNAVTNEDGTQLEGNSSLEATVINYSGCSSSGSLQPERVTLEVPSTTTSYDLELTKPGDYCFALYHRNVAGTWSAMTGIQTASIGPLKVIDTRAYSVAKIDDAFFLIVIGQVPLGTPCIETQTVNGKYVVPNTEVVFSGTSDSGTLVADCG